MLQEFCLGESLKNFNKKIEYIELLTQKKKNEVLQLSSTNFQILNYYIIVHYEYFLPMWVSMRP